MELGGHSGEDEVEGPEAKDGKDVGGEDDEGFAGDREDSRYAVDGKNDVRHLDEEEGEEQWGPHQASRLPDEELLVMKLLRNGQKSFQQPNQDVLGGIGMGFGSEGNLETGEKQEDAENQRHPGDLHQDGANRNEGRTEDQCPQNAVEEDPMAVLLRNRKEVEDDQEDEEVVDGEALLHQIA